MPEKLKRSKARELWKHQKAYLDRMSTFGIFEDMDPDREDEIDDYMVEMLKDYMK